MDDPQTAFVHQYPAYFDIDMMKVRYPEITSPFSISSLPASALN